MGQGNHVSNVGRNHPILSQVSPKGSRPKGLKTAAPEVVITSEVMEVTPEMAAHWLEGKGPNRRISDRQVARYAADMRAGEWHLNGEAVVFDREHALIDGQHRLWAVVESGCTVKMLIVIGVAPESMTTFDMGRSRLFSDVLDIRGVECDNTRTAAAAARILAWYDAGCQGTVRLGGATHVDLQEAVDRHPLVLRMADVAAGSKAKRLINPSFLAFVLTLGVEHDAEKATEFLGQLETGAFEGGGYESHEGNPVYHLRERLIQDRASKKRLDPTTLLAYAVKAMRSFLRGEEIRWLKYGKAANGSGEMEAFPRID